jgi:hypothetical protein
MSFQIHLRLEDIGLVGLTLCIKTYKMCFFEMLLQHLVIQVVLHLAARISPVADVASFVFLSAMLIELIVTIESLAAKATFWMTLESALVNSSWVVVTKFFMPPKLPIRKQIMLMSKDFLVASTQITKHFAVLLFDVAVQVRPSQACNIAVLIWTIVSEEENGVFKDDVFFVLDPKVHVQSHKIRLGKLFISLRSIVGKDHIRCFRLGQVSFCIESSGLPLPTLQYAQSRFLYSALNRRAQMWHVWWLQGAIDICSTVEAQMKHTSPSSPG